MEDLTTPKDIGREERNLGSKCNYVDSCPIPSYGSKQTNRMVYLMHCSAGGDLCGVKHKLDLNPGYFK